MPRRPLRFVHTSDVHLDDGAVGPAAALGRVVDATIASGADLLVVAGDLFDHNRVSDAVVAWFVREVERLSVPVVLLPGNHDCYVETSAYRRPTFRPPANVHLLDGRRLFLGDSGIEIWGRPVMDHSPRFRPLADVPGRTGGGWYLVVAHGHVELQPPAAGHPHRSSPISSAEIAETGADFVALGHWDRFADVSAGGVPAFYSGPPTHELNLIDLSPDRLAAVHRLGLRPP